MSRAPKCHIIFIVSSAHHSHTFEESPKKLAESIVQGWKLTQDSWTRKWPDIGRYLNIPEARQEFRIVPARAVN